MFGPQLYKTVLIFLSIDKVGSGTYLVIVHNCTHVSTIQIVKIGQRYIQRTLPVGWFRFCRLISTVWVGDRHCMLV